MDSGIVMFCPSRTSSPSLARDNSEDISVVRKLEETDDHSDDESSSDFPKKFWLSQDLYISKNEQSSTKRKVESEKVVCSKIDYKCHVVKEHSKNCSCMTPRLHMYLLCGHHCDSYCTKLHQINSYCNIEEEPITSEYLDTCEDVEVVKEEVDNSELLEDDSGSLTIDTEYIILSEEMAKISSQKVESNLENSKNSSVDFVLGKRKKRINGSNNNSKGKSKRDQWIRKKREEKVLNMKRKFDSSVRPTTNQNKCLDGKENWVPFRSLPLLKSLLSDPPNIKEEPADQVDLLDPGISATEFHMELQDSVQCCSSTASPRPTIVPSEDALTLLRNFESLIKEEHEICSEEEPSRERMPEISPRNERVPPNIGPCGLLTIKANEVTSSDGTVVGTVSYISPTKMKILLSPVKMAEDSQEKGLQTSQLTSDVKVPLKLNGGKIFNCSLCQSKFTLFSDLTDHLKIHQQNGCILCFYCQKTFGDRTNMKRHMRMHTGERPYQCKVCSKQFSLPGNFKKHRDIHEDIRSEPCKVCGKTFRRREHLKYHMRTHTGEKPYSCSLCNSSFTARYSLQIHMNIHLGKKPYKCNYCSKAFADKSTMRKHIRTHTGEKPFTCTVCQKGFTESGTLACHMATHTEDRPFSCSKCALTFKTGAGLRQHCKVHSGEKVYSCRFCGMRFRQKYNMRMHERIHTNEKPYTCSDCGFCFRSRSCLAKHVMIHGGDQERRHKCGQCQKKFFRKAHLKRHVGMHLGQKDFECKTCSKKFSSKATLRSHGKTFHADGARCFPCTQCDKVFKREIYVSTHRCSKNLIKSMENDENPELSLFKIDSEEVL